MLVDMCFKPKVVGHICGDTSALYNRSSSILLRHLACVMDAGLRERMGEVEISGGSGKGANSSVPPTVVPCLVFFSMCLRQNSL